MKHDDIRDLLDLLFRPVPGSNLDVPPQVRLKAIEFAVMQLAYVHGIAEPVDAEVRRAYGMLGGIAGWDDAVCDAQCGPTLTDVRESIRDFGKACGDLRDLLRTNSPAIIAHHRKKAPIH